MDASRCDKKVIWRRQRPGTLRSSSKSCQRATMGTTSITTIRATSVLWSNATKKGKKRYGSYTPIQPENAKTCWLKSLKVGGLRPLYRLPALLEYDPKRPIMVVEGEKCVEAVLNNSTKAFPITWAGGTSAWQKTDWSPLYGRPLILVADGDEAGHKVMKALAAHLHPHCPDIRLVLPPIADGGPDIVDEIEAGRDVNAWLEKHVQTYEPDGMSPDGMSNGSPDRSPLQSPEGGNEDEWESLIAAGKDNSGVFFEPETLSRLVALKRNRPDQWINLRERIKRECPKVSILELDKSIHALLGGGARLQGHAIVWPQYVPCPKPVDGAALFSKFVDLIKTYVVMPEGGAEAVVAWVLACGRDRTLRRRRWPTRWRRWTTSRPRRPGR